MLRTKGPRKKLRKRQRQRPRKKRSLHQQRQSKKRSLHLMRKRLPSLGNFRSMMEIRSLLMYLISRKQLLS